MIAFQSDDIIIELPTKKGLGLFGAMKRKYVN